MPKNYIDHQLVLDGSINDRILEKPCQEGFIFVGKPSDITLCRNGTWQGSGFPKCKGEASMSICDLK